MNTNSKIALAVVAGVWMMRWHFINRAWTDLAPQREKSQRTIRRYLVEVEK